MQKKLSVGLVVVLALSLLIGLAPSTARGISEYWKKEKIYYDVVLQKGSPVVTFNSIAGGAPAPSVAQNETVTFKMVVDATKAKTEKLKTGPATYYPVTILAKSYKSPTQEFPIVGGGTAIRSSLIAKDAKGKVYTSGGDVDVSSVLGKKTTSKIGDGTVDPALSIIIQITLVNNVTDKSTGKLLMSLPTTSYYTTGKSYCVVKGSKSRLEGKAMPNDDTTKTLPNPLVGKPLDVDAGTGTLVTTAGFINAKNKAFGLIDNLTGQVWVMKITPAS